MKEVTLAIGNQKSFCATRIDYALILRLVLVAFSFYASACCAAAAASSADLVAKGQYLSRAGDCVSCHTAVNGKPFAGGLAMQTPFGPLSTPNITPDKETGIGAWSDDDFYKAMHEGIGKDGEYLYPVMPFPWYTIVTREDVLAIKAYLFSLAPVHNPRQPNTLRFPFNIRASLLAWREAFFEKGDFKADPAQSEAANRGNYLVNGLAHCGECHNAHPATGASRWEGSLEGGVVENWYAPNISSDMRTGIGAWSNADLVKFFKTGDAPGKSVAVGPMVEVVHSLSGLTDADLNAIATYLKTTPAKGSSRKMSDPAAPFARGGEIYLNNCASCHGVSGEGQHDVIPPLRANPVVLTEGPQNAISVILNGLAAKETYAPMLAIGATLSDDEVADVVNYVRQSWGNLAPATATSALVSKLRGGSASDLSGTQCTTVADAKLAAALNTAEIKKQLGALTDANIATTTPHLVSDLKARTRGTSNADLINGLTATMCGMTASDKSLNATQKAMKIGYFAQYVYIALSAKQL